MIFSTAGSHFFMGAAFDVAPNVELSPSDFHGQFWSEVGGMTSLGSVGETVEYDRQIEPVSEDPDGIVRLAKFPSYIVPGTMEIVADLNIADAGQLAILGAHLALSYAFRVVFNDAPAGGAPSERLFVAFIAGRRDVFDEANSTMRLIVNLELNSNIVRIDGA